MMCFLTLAIDEIVGLLKGMVGDEIFSTLGSQHTCLQLIRPTWPYGGQEYLPQKAPGV